MAKTEDTFSSSALVIYEQEGSSVLAYIKEPKKQKFILFNMRGREIELPAARLHLVPAKLPDSLSSDEEKVSYLLELYEEALNGSKGFDMEELWSFVVEDNKDFTTDALCHLYFGENKLKKHLLLRLALVQDKVYFKRKKNFFAPRSQDTVEELIKAEKVRQKKLELQKSTVKALEEKLKNPQAPLPDVIKDNIYLLERIAAGAPLLDKSAPKEAKDLLTLCNEQLKLGLRGNIDSQAYSLLRKIGYLHQNSNLSFVRHDLKIDFCQEALDEAQALPHLSAYDDLSEEEQEYRVNLTDLNAITIDDTTTLDMDDALSIEKTLDGYKLGIHISDVAAVVSANSALDKEAKAHGTSVYCPELTANMFPETLSQDKLSLISNRTRRCLSCIFEVDSNFEIMGSQIIPSLIEVKKRYTYDEVDKILESDETLGEHEDIYNLYNTAISYETKRLERGALKIPKRMVYIYLKDPNNVAKSDFYVQEIDEQGPARSLIGEMMILTNSVLADYGVKNSLPLIYRSQEASEPLSDDYLNQFPEGPARDYQQRAQLKRSNTSTEPALHATLALAAYAQATSPIRRYYDLCNQRQILTHKVKNEAFYTAEELSQIIEDCEDPMQRAMQVTRETRRFWLLKYLRKKQKRKETIKATIIRTDLKNPMAELEEIYIPVLVKTNREIHVGDEVTLMISAVDPVFDYLKLEIA